MNENLSLPSKRSNYLALSSLTSDFIDSESSQCLIEFFGTRMIFVYPQIWCFSLTQCFQNGIIQLLQYAYCNNGNAHRPSSSRSRSCLSFTVPSTPPSLHRDITVRIIGSSHHTWSGLIANVHVLCGTTTIPLSDNSICCRTWHTTLHDTSTAYVVLVSFVNS